MNRLHVKFFQMLLFGMVAMFMLPTQSAEAQIVASRNASNTLSCVDNTLQYGLYINLAGATDAFYKFQWSGFTEYSDGTAQLNGAFVNVDDANLKFNVSATFSGRTFNAPEGSPKEHFCATENTSDWYYYTSVSGNLMGVNGLWGANISISSPTPSYDVPAFQIGTGANITDQPGMFGASGWLDLVVTSQANNPANAITLASTAVGTEGDFNFRLTGESLTPPTGPTCQNLTSGGQIGGAQLNCGGFDPAPLTNNVTPVGGSGAIEYLWLASTTGCPTSPSGQGIANSNSPTYDPAYIAQTTYFIRCSRRVGCTSWVGESNCVAIIIDENCGPTCDNVTSGGQISGTQTNCGSFNPSTLTSSSAPSGGSGAIEYLWLSSTTGCPTSAINQGIANSNSPTYNPGTITQTTYFLRCSRRAGCTAWVGESNCITVTVDNDCPPTCDNVTSGGQISGTQTNCGSFNPSTLTSSSAPSGGSGAIEYLWLSSTTGCPTSAINQGIANSNSPTYNPGTITQTTYFLRCSRRAGCTAWVGESNCITVTVDNDCPPTCDNVTSGGQISGTQTNCGPFNPSTLTSSSAPSGGSGAIEYLWLSSTTGCPTSAINQGIANSNSPTYNPGTITQTTYFLRCSRRAGCTAWVGESNCITVTVDNNCGGDDIDLELTFTSPQASVNAYTSFDGTITITNNSSTTATGVVVEIDKNGNVVQSGSVSQGNYSSWPNNVWNVGTLAPGQSATFDGAFYALQNNPQIYAQVSAAHQNDIDSTPGNGACCSAGEDDEAVISYGDDTVTCPVTITANTMNIQCNDNGTPDNPNDDTYTFQVMANASAPAGVALWGWFVEGNSSVMYDYGQAVSFGPYPISGGNQTLTIIDQDNLTCEFNVTANAPAPCSTNPTQPSISVSDITVNENVGNANVNICLSSATNQNVTFIASTGGGSATAGSDYSNQSFAIFIPAGNTCATFAVPIIDDSSDEPNETVNVTLSGVGNATVADGAGIITIVDNDAPSGNLIDLELTFTSLVANVSAYTSFTGTITVTNNSNTTATGVVVDIDKNGNVVQSGTVSQGNYSSWPTNVWTIGTLAPGQSATFEGAFYALQNTPQIYAQVSVANENDVDSTPGNGACCSAGEDDEAVISYGDDTVTCPVTITANTMNVQCNDNGTPDNPNDDTYTFQVMANASAPAGVSLWGWFVEGNSSVMYDYGQAVSFGPYPISGGNQTLTIIDQDNLTCEFDVTANAPAPCSNPVNTTPTAVNDFATTESNTSVIVLVTNNDNFGGDGPNNGQIVITSNPSNGITTVNNNGTPSNPTDDYIVYVPNGGFTGTDYITYRITDSNGDTDTAIVTITVSQSNGTPTAINDFATTTEGNSVMVMVTMNDSFGPDGPNNGQIVITSNPSNGTAVVNTNGTPADPTDDKVTYTPNAGFTGTDLFTYRITDSNGDTDTAVVSLIITPNNNTPTAVDDIATTDSNASIMIMVTMNDSFGADGPNNWQVVLTTNPTFGVAYVNTSGTNNDPTDDKIVYIPNSGFVGTDQLVYRIADADGDLSYATVTINVTAANGTPNAVNDNTSVNENSTVTIDVTNNDNFGTDGPATGMISIISSPSNGTVTVNGNGTATTDDDTITYTPDPGFSGADSFTYQITDSNGDTDTATVSITVNAVGPDVCNTSTVSNASSGGCNTNDFSRAFYSNNLVSGLSGSNNDSYNISNGVFTEYDDGTATFTGTFTMHSNSNARFNAVVNFSGKTFNGSAKTSSCTNSTADWYYYPNVSGTLTGTHHLAGGLLNITALTGIPNDEFQVGTGANLFDANLFGGSAWLSYTIVSQPNGSAYFNSGAQTDFNFVLSGSPTACGTNPDGGGNGTCADGKDVLFVVGNTNLNNGDDAARDILVDLGFDVMLVDDDVVSTSSANGKELIVISSTVSSSKVGTKFKHVSTPVVVWEAWLFDDMHIANGSNYGTQGGEEIHIFDENHPITDGFSGDVTVYTSHRNLSWGTPQSYGNDQAFIPGSSSKCVIITYDAGEDMAEGFDAPGRRIGLFLHNDGAAYLTAAGKTLVENAFLYAVDCPTSGQSSGNYTAPQADLITMTAKRALNNVDVKWANNTGYKNAHFLVQHSLDGVSFETIAEVDNDTDDENLAFYAWTHETPTIGENYYRIQVMYRDAQGWNFSDDSKVMFSEIFDFQLFPNPATDYVDLNLEEIEGNAVTITIVNQLGQTIQVEQINEATSLHRLQLQNIKYDGQYVVWITTKGMKPIAKSLMIMSH